MSSVFSALINPKYLDLRWWGEALLPRMRILRASVGFKPRVVEKISEGVSYKFFISSPTAEIWYGDARSDNDARMGFVRDKILRPGDRVIECGSHHGYTTIMLSRWVGDRGKVYACEPMPDNVSILRRNLDLNEIQNVKIVPFAMGPQTGKISLLKRSNASVLGQRHSSDALEIGMITIDDFCESEGFVPDLIKIDVEGFEYEVLAGAARVLQKSPALQIEVHPHQIRNYGKTATQLWDLLGRGAYEFWYMPDESSAVRRIDGPIEIVNRSHLYCIPLARTANPVRMRDTQNRT